MHLHDHPGGAEVLLDVAGGDADEFFEDIGHSNEARQELKKYEIGSLKLDEATLAKLKAGKEKQNQSGSGIGLVVLVVALAAVAFGYYQTQLQAPQEE